MSRYVVLLCMLLGTSWCHAQYDTSAHNRVYIQTPVKGFVYKTWPNVPDAFTGNSTSDVNIYGTGKADTVKALIAGKVVGVNHLDSTVVVLVLNDSTAAGYVGVSSSVFVKVGERVQQNGRLFCLKPGGEARQVLRLSLFQNGLLLSGPEHIVRLINANKESSMQ